ncbi:50S ribosomal protein L29 [Candidatus Falkowbacteria bacterium RBG_13_39_14]|uniref:Large ribosomal subunit protein uL29 n=1 Tax=Candidatus Falkowbacteria bacterium RBG_13_39_14 TaxID=1797985 RepID=A0A1F5S494_9BACT|nr:MAG: 50S ribosomal protein L29 [Candidatus Falkowbacteria bacterium RBG_13_39_14]
MEITDLKGKSKKALKNLLAEKQAGLIGLKFKIATGSLKNVREIRVIKKDIARIMTFMRAA